MTCEGFLHKPGGCFSVKLYLVLLVYTLCCTLYTLKCPLQANLEHTIKILHKTISRATKDFSIGKPLNIYDISCVTLNLKRFVKKTTKIIVSLLIKLKIISSRSLDQNESKSLSNQQPRHHIVHVACCKSRMIYWHSLISD